MNKWTFYWFPTAPCREKLVDHTNIQKTNSCFKGSAIWKLPAQLLNEARGLSVFWPLSSCQAPSFDSLQRVLCVPTAIFIFPKHPMLFYGSVPCFTLFTLPGTSFPHTTPPTFPCLVYLENFQETKGECLWNFPEPPSPLLPACLPLDYLWDCEFFEDRCRTSFS